MNLPETFVADGLVLAENMRLFGKSLADLTREELIAAAAQGWDALRLAREQHRSSMEIMRLGMRASVAHG